MKYLPLLRRQDPFGCLSNAPRIMKCHSLAGGKQTLVSVALLVLWNNLWTVSLGHHLVSFLQQREDYHSSLLTDLQCLINHCFIHSLPFFHSPFHPSFCPLFLGGKGGVNRTVNPILFLYLCLQTELFFFLINGDLIEGVIIGIFLVFLKKK